MSDEKVRTYRSRTSDKRVADSVCDSMPPIDDHPPAPCQRCFTLTSRKELSHFGARCRSCFDAFCRHPQPQVDVGDKREGPRSWAYALKRREEAGEQLTAPQMAMWRAALRQENPS